MLQKGPPYSSIGNRSPCLIIVGAPQIDYCHRIVGAKGAAFETIGEATHAASMDGPVTPLFYRQLDPLPYYSQGKRRIRPTILWETC
jgi:hypothetical protein